MMRIYLFAMLMTSVLTLTGCNNKSVKATIESDEEDKNLNRQDQTTKNLNFALAGECLANRKYTAFAEIADHEGYPQVAKLWRAAAAAEGIHAKNHLKALGMLKSTKQNLEGAVEGEQYEFETMYPRFVKTAQEAGLPDAANSMEWAFKVEQLHHSMFNADLEDLETGHRPAEVSYWICGVCGNTVPVTPPEKCNICGSPKTKFFEVK